MLVKKYLFLLYLLGNLNICLALDTVPDFFEVDYTLYRDGAKVGLMERRFLKQDDGTYNFRSESKTTGLIALLKKIHIVESSTWNLDDSTFKPLYYTYQHTKGKRNRDVEISFNWEKKQIINRVNDSTWYMQTQPGILDKLLYQLTIMSDLKSGKVPESYTIADGGKIKQYQFEHLSDELLNTPLGEFKTMKLARYKPNSKQQTFLWCAYNLDFLPVKVTNIEKDEKLTTAIIHSLKGFGINSEE
ncbi:MAG: DUF3108 domain-containing protein [Proteobacteria bacterium]|nr:DUF3108 domain-containing protein [Pseudomonadota bacterium]